MRAIWKGSIAFGLAHIPVNLYPATESHSISSNLLHTRRIEELETEFEEKLQRWIPIRDELLESFGFWAGEPPSKAAENIGSVLERLLPFKFAPGPLPQGGWPTIATDGLAVFLYELFLRTVGTLLSLNAHETLAALLQRLEEMRHFVSRNARTESSAHSPTFCNETAISPSKVNLKA